MKVVDVAVALERLGEGTGSTPLLEAGGESWQLLRVEPGDRFEVRGEGADGGGSASARALLVLDGEATFRVDELRQSLGSGHLLLVEHGERLSVTGDGTAPMTALLRTRVPPSPLHGTRAPAPPEVQP